MTSPPRAGSGRSGWFPVVLRFVLRAGLGGVLIYAGAVKTASPQVFADSVASFRLLPDALVNPVALGLPVLEMMAGSWLLSGWRPRPAAFTALALCAGFLLALGSAAVRGIAVHCGCFGENPLSGNSHLPTAIARDLVLLGAALYLYVAGMNGCSVHHRPPSHGA